jgi:hypothetical protein
MKKKKILQFAVFMFITFTVSAQKTYFVNINNGNDSNDGLSWDLAFKNLQTALDKAVKNDAVWVAAGIYTPTKKYAEVYKDMTPTTERDKSFIISDSVVVMGGFPANSSNSTGLSSRDWKKNRTVLTGDFQGDDDGYFGNISDNACHVVVLIGASPQLVLDGFFIEGGNSNAPQTAYYKGERKYPIIYGCGGGIYCSSFDKIQSPTLRNLHIHSNFAAYEGGGLYIVSEELEASPVISNVTFMNNKAISNYTNGEGGHGGGLLVEGRQNKANLTNVIIMGNSALSDGDSRGGGAYFRAIEDCTPTLQNTLIAGNISNIGGGAYFNSRTATAQPVLTNATVSANRTEPNKNNDPDIDGGGLMVYAPLGDAYLVIRNTAICDNLGKKTNRNEVFLLSADDKQFDIIYLNSFVKGAALGGTSLPGNTDPMFVLPADANLAPTGNEWFDYLPQLGSPLINRGDNSVVTSSTDLNSNARIYNGTVDIGAYESQGVNPPPSNETIASEGNIWANANTLYVKIENPAILKIHALNGMLIEQATHKQSGIYQYTLPRGIYIVELNNGKKGKIVIN